MNLTRLFFMIMMCLLSLQFLFAGSRKPKDYTPGQLEMATDTLTIGNLELTLETYLWRDFMPQSPPDGKPLRASVTVVSAIQGFPPADINTDKLWIINSQEVWSTTLKSVREYLPTEKITRIEKMASDGPKWGPGILVTVVIQIIDQQGNSHLLKAKDQLIHRTD